LPWRRSSWRSFSEDGRGAIAFLRPAGERRSVDPGGAALLERLLEERHCLCGAAGEREGAGSVGQHAGVVWECQACLSECDERFIDLARLDQADGEVREERWVSGGE